MGFWSNLFDRDPSGITANPNPESSVSPTWEVGDPEGVDLSSFSEPTEARSLPVLLPTPWDGWPANWGMPNWDFGSRFNELIDVAWMCLDINSRVLSSMPVYRTRSGQIVEPDAWMNNPDPAIYSSWDEFAKQLFWDYQLGEAFVLPMAFYSDGWPMRFRVVPPWLVHVEMRSGARVYRLGATTDVTADILHIRYKSTTDSPRGVGPLETAGGRMLTAGVLAKYVREVASTGGEAGQTLETEQELTSDDARDIRDEWILARLASASSPPVLDKGIALKDHQVMAPRDMALLELAQFTESRIAQLLGVPPFLAGLPATGGGDGGSMTYSNVSQIFDYHDRSALRPFASAVMKSLSNWALPRGQAAELNRDEYSRPAFNERADAWVKLKKADLITTEQFQAAERLLGMVSAQALTGATLNGSQPSEDGGE